MHRSPKLNVARPRESGPWAKAAPALRLPRVMSIRLIEPRSGLIQRRALGSCLEFGFMLPVNAGAMPSACAGFEAAWQPWNGSSCGS